ncbi:hypothetical protein [Adhaeribacter soli]|uniref:Uncharacterized protein n=1 Tax=Adhaeribacter soli TaxID=2607655 RepID=A0A5N1J6W8_9BACT|nr:hypothetical protein [Adhaeribacter soli]KAA9345863.1 hypothetical protein F0P94_01920 [Adhaeribacter soli]
MSHIYSLAFVTMFLFYSRELFTSPRIETYIILAALLALIVLIRPLNIITVLLLPFAAGSLPKLKSGLISFFSNKLALTASGITFLALVSLQVIIYKLTTGHWLVYSYGEEGFNFLNPHFVDILFSYKKGLFLYTPLFFISLIGGYFLWKQNRFQFITLFGFLVFLTYLLSSWWSWWYGGSFSGRPFLEFTPLFMLLLAFTLNGLQNSFAYRSYSALIIFLILVCQFQTYQYRKGYIHWEDMTREKYWEVFLNPRKLLL